MDVLIPWTANIFSDIYDIVFPLIAQLVGYLQSFATMPSIAIEYLLRGGTYEWEVINFLTGDPMYVHFYSYGNLLTAFENYPVLGDVLGLLYSLLQGLGEIIYDILFSWGDGYDYLGFPLWIALPLACIRMWFLMTIIKWVLSLR